MNTTNWTIGLCNNCKDGQGHSIINGLCYNCRHPRPELGTPVLIDGWHATICDLTISNGTIYAAVTVKAMPALYLENQWHNMNKLTSPSK
jgi:hypothetical protein